MKLNKDKLKQVKESLEKTKNHTILLVDDEEANIRFLSQLLENDFTILKAYNGYQALDVIKNNLNISLILSDQRMPGITGTELLKKALEILPHAVRIILTGYIDINSISEAINEGHVYKFLTKPIEPKDLKVTIQRALESFDLEKSNSDLFMELRELNKSLENKVEERTSKFVELNNLQKGLVASIVHDLKNPLSNILMFSKQIIDRESLLEKAKNTSELINTSGKQMLDMVENLLEINKIEQGVIIPDKEVLELVGFINKTIQEFSNIALKKNISLYFLTEINSAKIIADKILLKRILDNLISNAIKFSEFNKKIKITLKTDSIYFTISIKDEGPGLKSEDKTKLFKKFTRLSAQPTDGEHSTGLGLSIVKNLVEVMNGKVWCESEYGKGACFSLSFLHYDALL